MPELGCNIEVRRDSKAEVDGEKEEESAEDHGLPHDEPKIDEH